MSDTIEALTETVRGRVIETGVDWPFGAGATAFPDSVRWTTGCNFGVVTSFEFLLHEVGDVVGGPLFYDFDDATAVLECYRSYIKEAPEQLGRFFGWQIAPPLPFTPRTGSGTCPACWSRAGTIPHGEAEKVLRPLRHVAEVQAAQP